MPVCVTNERGRPSPTGRTTGARANLATYDQVSAYTTVRNEAKGAPKRGATSRSSGRTAPSGAGDLRHCGCGRTDFLGNVGFHLTVEEHERTVRSGAGGAIGCEACTPKGVNEVLRELMSSWAKTFAQVVLGSWTVEGAEETADRHPRIRKLVPATNRATASPGGQRSVRSTSVRCGGLAGWLESRT